MLDSIRFVQGAVAKKDFIPVLTHFKIQGGLIRSYNGMLGLQSPIDLNLDVSPQATAFVKAIQTCKDTIQLHVTPTGKLSVKSGKFRALVDCIQEVFPEVIPEGETVTPDGSLLEALKLLAPFIAEDASRQFARGILFRGRSAFATNNICIVEKWLGYEFPKSINIPRAAVAELLRIGEEPSHLQVAETSVTFHFSGDRWLRTQTYTTEWPDVSRILDRPSATPPVVPPTDLWDALRDLKPFVDDMGRIYMKEGSLATSSFEGEGAVAEVPGLVATGVFNVEQLLLLEGLAETISFDSHPAPAPFFGNGLRGAIVGIRT